jgi:hypothetical protein
MRSSARIVGTAAAGVVWLSACGARSYLPVDEMDAQPASPTTCKGVDVPIAPRVPNLYFVLDISGSMALDNKWANVRSAVASVIADLGTNARFGAAVFPAPGAGSCAAGVEVMPLRAGDDLGVTQSAFLSATALTPTGGTPTAATFRALFPEISAFPGVSFVVLATDGGPNCNPGIATCSIDECTRDTDSPNQCRRDGGPLINCCAPPFDGIGCLDVDATSQAVSDLRASGVQTFVMGIPGSAPYGPGLDRLAVSGGTARASEPLYYRVDSADTDALKSALVEIADRSVKSCTVALERSPKDQGMLNVYVDGAVVPSQGGAGWSSEGQKVTLTGSACQSVQRNGPAPTLRVVEGCPTVY